jgi:hypothetical protein
MACTGPRDLYRDTPTFNDKIKYLQELQWTKRQGFLDGIGLPRSALTASAFHDGAPVGLRVTHYSPGGTDRLAVPRESPKLSLPSPQSTHREAIGPPVLERSISSSSRSSSSSLCHPIRPPLHFLPSVFVVFVAPVFCCNC